MTRINCIPVTELTQAHLVAEYRELPRLRHAKVVNRQIPKTYRMGIGHCLFFYDKGKWLEDRHLQLINEMKRRGYNVNLPALKLNWPQQNMNDWQVTNEAIKINRERIKERLNE